jgi:GT2 family glycosyltransferase
MWDQRVTAIVINWNLKETTAMCLRSLDRIGSSGHIIVVDNGSQDGSLDYLRDRFPGVEFISLPENVGFAAACNCAIQRALQRSACQSILLVNNDAILAPDALSKLMEAAESNPETGILGPKVYYRDEPERIWYAGARMRRGVLAAADTGRGQVDRGQFDQPSMVDYVFGTVMLIQRKVFESVGLFDERFFLYLEDLDLCLRAKKKGFSLLFVPEACVWHIGSASTAQHQEIRKFHYVKSTIIFLKKHLSRVVIPLALLFWSAVLIRMVIQDILRGNLSTLDTCWSALVSGLGEIE